MRLTGNKRFRTLTRWGKQYIVLQVEEIGTVPDPYGPFVEIYNARQWRDAKLEDLAIADVKVYKE